MDTLILYCLCVFVFLLLHSERVFLRCIVFMLFFTGVRSGKIITMDWPFWVSMDPLLHSLIPVVNPSLVERGRCVCVCEREKEEKSRRTKEESKIPIYFLLLCAHALLLFSCSWMYGSVKDAHTPYPTTQVIYSEKRKRLGDCDCDCDIMTHIAYMHAGHA